MAGIAGYVVLGFAMLVWLYMAYYVVATARDRGSRLWPLHGIGALALGIVYVIPYWLLTNDG